jgi:hypothetical protein
MTLEEFLGRIQDLGEALVTFLAEVFAVATLSAPWLEANVFAVGVTIALYIVAIYAVLGLALGLWSALDYAIRFPFRFVKDPAFRAGLLEAFKDKPVLFFQMAFVVIGITIIAITFALEAR